MFGRRITLFNLFGFAVRVDASWLIIAALVTWSLADGVFPAYFKGLPPRTYWLMGIAGAIALFLSIIAHEFSHAMVARRFGIPMKGITLFIFGGVAEMENEPPSATSELVMAIAGPIASVFVSVTFFALLIIGSVLDWRVEVVGVFGYLAWVNILLVAFNMIPAFPLDGGRVLRSLLWMWKDNLRWATRIASQTGALFGFGLIALGVIIVIMSRDIISGIWLFLIGMFLRNMAAMSYQQVVIRQTLEGEPVSRFMKTNPVTVPRAISVQDLVDEYIYKLHFKMFPVVEGERLLGCVTTRMVQNLPRDEWDRQTVGSIAEACSARNTIAPDTDAMAALGKMNASGMSRLIVAEGDRIVGILSLKDLLRFLSLKMELEQGEK